MKPRTLPQAGGDWGLRSLATSVALAQQSRDSSAPQGQPEAAGDQVEGATAGKQNTAPEQDDAARLLPALHGIESAIRDLIADEDQVSSERQEQRDIADLQAQKEMALWAKYMLWVTGAGAFLTGVGIILIWRTLHYTRIAAVQAGEAVIEARKTTAAAIEATAAAKDANGLLLADQRPWLDIDVDTVKLTINGNGNLQVNADISVKNIGRTPAIDATSGIRFFDAKVGGFAQQPVDEFYDLIAGRRNGGGRNILPNGVARIGCGSISGGTSGSYDELKKGRGTYLAICVAYTVPGAEAAGVTGILFKIGPAVDKPDEISGDAKSFVTDAFESGIYGRTT